LIFHLIKVSKTYIYADCLVVVVAVAVAWEFKEPDGGIKIVKEHQLQMGPK
jgi:hypothetical protein